jgi:hypothetical protein
MPSIDDIAAEYVERAAALDPCYATYTGIAGHDHELTDLSADRFAGRAELDHSTLTALDAAQAPDPREQVARAAMRERLALAVERYDAGDTTEAAGDNPISQLCAIWGRRASTSGAPITAATRARRWGHACRWP